MKAAACLVFTVLVLAGCTRHPELIERYQVAHDAWVNCTANTAVKHYNEGVDPQTSARLAMKLCKQELHTAIKAYAIRMDISFTRSATAYAHKEKDNEETLVLLGIRQATLDDAWAAMQDPVPLEFK